jgi:hypothetical protein
MLIAKEDKEMEALKEWVSYQPLIRDIFVHIPNEGKRTSWIGNKLKRMGLKVGISDIFIPYPIGMYHGLWIEMKRRRNYRIALEQLQWLDMMNKLGYYARVALGWEQAKEIIENYLSIKN